MSESDSANPPSDQPPQQPPGDPPAGSLGTHTQQFSHNPVAARVPERLARGVHATGALVLDSPTEFVIDFVQSLTRPFQIVARIVVHPSVMGQLAGALKDNMDKYAATFGMPQTSPQQPQRRPTIQEIYENFKLPEENWSGAYANSVMIGHSQGEFYLDFITGFYPTAAVSSRVFVAPTQVPRIVETLGMAIQQHQRRLQGGGGQQPPPANPNP
jgi:hypothetical protein